MISKWFPKSVLILTIVLCISSCMKNTLLQQETFINEKSWLKVNGKNYKDGILFFYTKDNVRQQVILDWSTAKKFANNNVVYTEVNFVSELNKERDKRIQNSNNSISDQIQFSVVFRTINDTLESVIKYTIPNTTLFFSDSARKGCIESYHSFDGKTLDVWFTDFATKKIMKRKILESQIISNSSITQEKQQIKRTSVYDPESVCYSTTESQYSYSCISLGASSSGDYNIECGWRYIGDIATTFCFSGSGGSDSWPPSSGGGDGYSGGSSNPSIPPKSPCPTSKEALKSAFPAGSNASLNALANLINEYGGKFGIDNEHKLRHFLAQAATETGGFSSLQRAESLNYSSATRLANIYPKHFSFINPLKKNPYNYLHNSERLANLVYRNRYGNGSEASGDGFRYRGRGIFQLTFKDNYQNFQDYYNSNFSSNLDLLNHPEVLVSNDPLSVISALWYFKTRVSSKISINSNTPVEQVTRLVNGKLNGINERKSYYNKTKIYIFCQ
jgi:putative chitinase